MFKAAGEYLNAHPTPTALFENTEDRELLWVNDAFVKMYGYDLDEVVGLSDRILKSDNSPSIPVGSTRRQRHRRNDGDEIYVDVSVTTVFLSGKEYGLASYFDVTDLVAARYSLLKSEHRAQRVQALSGVGMFEVDLRTGERYWSPELRAQCGYGEDESLPVTSQPISESIHPDDRERVLAEYAAATQERRPYSVDYRIVRRTGGTIWINEQVDFEYGSDGSPKRLLGTTVDITRRKQAEAKIEWLAEYDPLTNLPNREMMNKRVERAVTAARASGETVGALFLDIDGFKRVNDMMGHAQGDLLLIDVAHRLTESLRPEDLLARFGGDEFVVLLSTLGEDTENVARRVMNAFSRPFEVGGQRLYFTCSIGGSTTDLSGFEHQRLLAHADMAMSRAKRSGRGTVRMYEDEMMQAELARLAMEKDLRVALERKEFEVWYQPVVSVLSGEIVGAEALVRWRHPDGMRYPQSFIGLIEESDFLREFGLWVLSTSCRQAVQWRSRISPDFVMAVNISALQLQDKRFTADAERILLETGLAPERLEIEMTETAFADNADALVETLSALRSLGVRVALDDFGTGYNSLLNLRRCRVDTIKIDRTFVKEIASNRVDQAIAVALLTAGKNLGLRVVAEGVEYREHLIALQDLGCEDAQGYLFGKAMEASRFIEAFGGTSRSVIDALSA